MGWRISTVATLALMLALPAVQAHESADRTAQASYVAGIGDVRIQCTPSANLGGACFELTGFEHEASVRIDDALLERTPAAWKVTSGSGFTYASGDFCDETTFTIPNLHVDFAPRYLFVFVEQVDPSACDGAAGATSGEILVDLSGSGEGEVP